MPTVTIGQNSTDTFSGFVDTWLGLFAPTTNNDGAASFGVNRFGTGNHAVGYIKATGFNTTNIPAGSTITAASVNVKCQDDGAPFAVRLRRVLRNAVVGQATWNVYSTGNSWTTGGGLSDGNDRSATTTADATPNGVAYVVWSDAQLVTDLQNMLDGSVSNFGWHMERADAGTDDGNYYTFTASEGADGSRPYLSVTYTAPSSAILMGQAIL